MTIVLNNSKLASVLGALILAIAALNPSQGFAAWLRAETENFVIIGDLSEKRISNIANNMEVYRNLLHHLNAVEERKSKIKLTLYTFNDREDLKNLLPNIGSNVTGIIFSAPYSLVAFATTEDDEFQSYLSTIAHEYYHHFMFSEMPGAYPRWIVEGYAEYYSEIHITDKHIDFGIVNKGRSIDIARGLKTTIEKLLQMMSL